MKKTRIDMTKKLFFILFCSCLFILNVSCGLDVIEFYYPPKTVIGLAPLSVNEENYMVQDQNEMFIGFYVNNTENNSSPTFNGTNIYYKIYNNINTAISEKNQIVAQLDTEYSNQSITRMIGYNYKKLNKSNLDGTLVSDNCLIPKSGSNDLVRIELQYLNNPSQMKIGNQTFIPRRENNLTFDFSSYKDRPVYKEVNYSEYDSDVSFGTATEENTWFVMLFAVSTGVDYTFTEHNSSVLYLGCIPLKDDR